MATAISNKRKMYLTTAGVFAFGVAAYGLGRVYPPMGPSAGTIAPAGRYQSAQIGDSGVTLGDSAVAELMQTDAFASPGFQATMANPQALQALQASLANPQALQALQALQANPKALQALQANPQALQALQAQASSAMGGACFSC